MAESQQEQELPLEPSLEKAPPLSTKLREKAAVITKLLTQYRLMRYGDKTYRFGDEQYIQSQGREGTKPFQSGIPPSIKISSSPRNLFATDPTQTENKVTSPLLIALINMQEMDVDTALQTETLQKFAIFQDLGLSERYECVVLIEWARKLAAIITYIYETKEVYSQEIRAIYPDLLVDLERGRGVCDQLVITLGQQGGILSQEQFRKLINEVLHYARLAQSAALQLADHHEEYMAKEISPLESPSMTWILKGEEPKPITLEETQKTEKTPEGESKQT